MECLQFLDLTGLEADEVHEINSWLFSSSPDYQLPWIIKQKDQKRNDCGKVDPPTNFNGTSIKPIISAPDQVNYPPQMTFIGLPYNHNQPQIVPFMPNHYQHTTIYPNFQHPPPIMGSRDAIHFMYPNQVYNYTQVPVTYQNHTQNTQYYTPDIHNLRSEEIQIYNEVPNENVPNYEEQRTTEPHDNTISNNEQVSSNITCNNIPAESLEKTGSNEYEKLVTPIVKPPEVEEKFEKVEIANVNDEKIMVKASVDEKCVSKSNECVKNDSIKLNGITEKDKDTPVNVWAKKPWVSLFKKDTPITNGRSEPETQISNGKSTTNTKVENLLNPSTYKLGKFLLNYKIDGTITNFQPRGLRNKSNYCYINAILQALLACPPLCNLLKGLSKNINPKEDFRSIPMIRNMCEFINEFDSLTTNMTGPPRSKKKQNKKPGNFNIDTGDSFEATGFYTMLNGTRSDSFLVEGRQEDAEEFLGMLLNGLNDEMMSIMKSMNKEENIQSIKKDSYQDCDDWKVMGPKNKGNITRKVQFDKTPISDIFGGLLCSKIHKTGDETTVNIQPFFTLQLNIEKANTITEALEGLTARNQLEGLTSSKTKQSVEAWQQVMIEQLPVVLVLHLKCFDYKLNGCTKIMKTVEFPIDLQIDGKILSGKTHSAAERNYKLFAVVYHEGKEASKGHYIVDVFHPGYNVWLRFDDAKIKTVTEESVLRPQGFRVPYLLLYRRSDTV